MLFKSGHCARVQPVLFNICLCVQIGADIYELLTIKTPQFGLKQILLMYTVYIYFNILCVTHLELTTMILII